MLLLIKIGTGSPLLVVGQTLGTQLLLIKGQLQPDHRHLFLALFKGLDEALADLVELLEGGADVDHLLLADGDQLR